MKTGRLWSTNDLSVHCLVDGHGYQIEITCNGDFGASFAVLRNEIYHVTYSEAAPQLEIRAAITTTVEYYAKWGVVLTIDAGVQDWINDLSSAVAQIPPPKKPFWPPPGHREPEVSSELKELAALFSATRFRR